MAEEKVVKMAVTALKEGTVIDHVPAGQVFKVVDVMNLYEYKKALTSNLEEVKRMSEIIDDLLLLYLLKKMDILAEIFCDIHRVDIHLISPSFFCSYINC